MSNDNCKTPVTQMLEAPLSDEPIPHLPQISPGSGDGFMQQLQQAIEPHPVVHTVATLPDVHPQSTPPPSALQPSPKTEDANMKDRARPSLLDMTEDERIRRRREINRNSQRRIRERRMKELAELRTETTRLQQENEQLLRQVECITAEKAELLRQIQEITEKWQQSIAENAVLNRENLQFRTSIQQITGIPSVVTGSIAGGVPAQQPQALQQQQGPKQESQEAKRS